MSCVIKNKEFRSMTSYRHAENDHKLFCSADNFDSLKLKAKVRRKGRQKNEAINYETEACEP